MTSGKSPIRKGTVVRWSWSGSTASGRIVEIHRSRVTRKINGSESTRYGSSDNPAYVIEQEDGSRVLKLRDEVERA